MCRAGLWWSGRGPALALASMVLRGVNSTPLQMALKAEQGGSSLEGRGGEGRGGEGRGREGRGGEGGRGGITVAVLCVSAY